MTTKNNDELTAYDILGFPECPIKLPRARSMTQARIDYESREEDIFKWYNENKHLFIERIKNLK